MQNRDRQLLVICGAIALSLFMVNAVLTFLYFSRPLPAAEVPRALPVVLFSLGLVLLGAAPAAKGAVFKRADAEGFDGNPDRRFAAYQTATLVAFAMREAAGLLGFVLAMLTGNPWWSWGLGGAALIAMFMDRPRPGMFRRENAGSAYNPLPYNPLTQEDLPIPTPGSRPEAVQLELFTHRFAAIARQMGERLQRTAVSTNVKERLDFSCALLDPAGELVVNAPHIPVHLGALGLCVRSLREAIAMEPGDVIVTNHPAFGGSHLPDVTVVTPVFGDGGALLGYVASRAHHAEIGGIRPGSMPPGATRLIEEGVVIPPTHLIRHGQPRWEDARKILLEAPFPTRAVEENLADLRAAVAANHRGADALCALVREHGRETVLRYMAALKARAGERLRAALARLPSARYEAMERLDDGSPLAVRIEIAGAGSDPIAVIDFAGSAGVHPGNLNAPPAVTRSAILYVLRLLIAEPLPLNEGILAAVDIRIPPGMLNPPFPGDPADAPAVVGGNVETSQRLVDTLLKALGLAACSQGTMNNLLFGNERFGFYETVCGGAGAGPGFHGASAVHTHMTNTRITDPEVLEHRYPVRLERFGVRTGSGGAGRYRGGDGAVRELTFLEPMSLSLLSQHRVEEPYGVAGGEPGERGRQRLVRASGEVEELASVDGREVAPGDRLILETPGGGGWGSAADASPRTPPAPPTSRG